MTHEDRGEERLPPLLAILMIAEKYARDEEGPTLTNPMILRMVEVAYAAALLVTEIILADNARRMGKEASGKTAPAIQRVVDAVVQGLEVDSSFILERGGKV